MNRIRFAAALTLAITVTLAVSAAPAKAVGVGFYGTAGIGDATGDAGWDLGGGLQWDRETRHAGGGLVLDFPTGFRFGYRLGIGYERIVTEGERGAPDGELEGLVLDHDFAFDLLATPASRVWAGPELRLGFLHGSPDNSPGGSRDFFAAGVGPVVGFDLALGPAAALSWKFGYLYTWYYADENTWDDRYNDHYYDDSEMDEGHAYISMALLFRLGGGPQPGPQPYQYQPQYQPRPQPYQYQPQRRW